MKTPPLKGNEKLYNLQGQLDHKIDFVNRFIPKSVNVYLIAHSIGAKICLDLLKHKQFSDQVRHVYLMFPVIERLGESRSGKLVPTFKRYFFLLRASYNLFALLPMSWRRAIVRWRCRKEGIPEKFLEICIANTNPSVLDRIWFMTLDEMEKVKEIDHETVQNNMNKLKLYYGVEDGWVRNEAYQEITEKFPGIDAELCNQGYAHAFVLNTSKEVASMVSQWIRQIQKIKE